jgi:hypothetical protein
MEGIKVVRDLLAPKLKLAMDALIEHFPSGFSESEESVVNGFKQGVLETS